MIRFNSDYQEGAHPRILQRMLQTNLEQHPGYGEDECCAEARAMIQRACEAPEVDVHFLVGGTQTNFTFLAAALRCYQGAVCADTAHIAVHETGSVEATGHKVITLPQRDGKITAAQVDECCRLHFSDGSHEHMVMPKVVYLSESTELGTVYTRAELTEMRAVCDKWKLWLYVDGARLGYAMASEACDVDLPFLARTADAFYIGGTKQGALFGEALVIVNDALKPDFRYVLKQKGGMLAKGWLLGIQFSELFRDGLYFELSDHAQALAMRLKVALTEWNVPFLVDSPTNQQFPVLPDGVLDALAEKYSFSEQQRVDATHRAVRFCTSWATQQAQLDALISDLRALLEA
ncbi:MAG: beta-eliminating lyase-related protein [Eubacteriales bacterium]|nr:beta-eliminating lyase-related protein [Eubacteriales bacterium]